MVIKETREKNREKEKRHFTGNQRCRGEETGREGEGSGGRERETCKKREEKGKKRESLLLISLDPKFRQAHTEARAVPVGLGPWHCVCECVRV